MCTIMMTALMMLLSLVVDACVDSGSNVDGGDGDDYDDDNDTVDGADDDDDDDADDDGNGDGDDNDDDNHDGDDGDDDKHAHDDDDAHEGDDKHAIIFQSSTIGRSHRTRHTSDSTKMDKGGGVEDQGAPAVGPLVDGRSVLHGARLH